MYFGALGVLFIWCKKRDRIDDFFIEGLPFHYIHLKESKVLQDFFNEYKWMPIVGIAAFFLIYYFVDSLYSILNDEFIGRNL